MANQNPPAVGTQATYKGQNGAVVGTRKIGRGYSVRFQPVNGEAVWVRLADWTKGVQ